MKLFGKKVNKTLKEFSDSGIYIESIDDNKVRNNRDIMHKCLWNAVIMTFIIYGCAGLFASAFMLPVNHFVLMIFAVLGSFYFSFMRLNSITFNGGYILFFFLIIFLSITLFLYINSGFNAIMNMMIVAVDDEFNLPSIREFTEIIGNRYVTITVCISFLEIVAACFISMWLTKRMSISSPFLYSLIFVILSTYLNDNFSYFHLILIIFGNIMWMLTLDNDEIPMNYQKKYKSYKVIKKSIFIKDRRVDSKGNMIGSVVITVLILISSYIIFLYVPSSYIERRSSAKAKSDEIVYDVAFRGLSALFGKTSDNGGMNNGSFGKNGKVSFDYETDLSVRFIPVSADPVYLKMFNANYYDNKNSRWVNNIKGVDDSYDGTRQLLEKNYLNQDKKAAFGYMEIINVGLPGDFIISPYYNDSYKETSAFNISNTYSTYYFPNFYSLKEMINFKEEHGDIDILKLYLQKFDVENDYLNIDGYTLAGTKVSDELKKICDTQGFGGTQEEIIIQISDYLSDNFEYSLNPGTTPSGEDFVIDFLKDKKQGYCVHFASAACLLLRSMNIPARYVEGYCFDIQNIDDATVFDFTDRYPGFELLNKEQLDSVRNIKNNNISYIKEGTEKTGNMIDLYSGYSLYDVYTPVEIDITDANAHAWVEIYIDGFGWVPYEFTTAAMALGGDMQEVSDGGLMSMLSGLLSIGGSNDTQSTNSQTISNIANNFNTKQTQKAFETAIMRLIITIISLIIVFCIIKKTIIHYKIYNSKENKRNINQYKLIVKLTKKLDCLSAKEKNCDDSSVYSHNVLGDKLINELSFDKELVDNYIFTNKEYNYSQNNISIDELTDRFRILLNVIIKRFGLMRRVVYYIKYYL